MVFLRRCVLILFALVFSAQMAAAAAGDGRFRNAAEKFRMGFWDLAAKEFAEFVERHPNSPLVPEALLYQAEAAITNRAFPAAVELLSTNYYRAGGLQDQFLFWIGQASMLREDYAAAAAAFEKLLSDCPASPSLLEAAIGAATARAELDDWPRVTSLLQETNSVFQRAARAGVTNDSVAYGYLLLGETQLEQTNFTGAGAALQSLNSQRLKPELSWRASYLETRLMLAEGRIDDALQNTTNLFRRARLLGNRQLQADMHAQSVVLAAEIRERLNLADDAIKVYQTNLAAPAPPRQQSHALIKIAELSIARDNIPEAVRMLEAYANQPSAAAQDLAWLTLGELQLKQHLKEHGTNRMAATATNLLGQALGRFDRVLSTFTNSPLVGKAFLGKGWCHWIEGDLVQSEAAFRSAAERLPQSEDQAIARFKLGDTQFLMKRPADAVENYIFLVTYYSTNAAVQPLLESALYQTVQAAVAATNITAAGAAMRKIFDWYPEGFSGPRCLLLLGEGYSQNNDPAAARKCFADFEARFPTNALLPEVRLAIARTYEQEGNWPAAVTNYEAWTRSFTNHADLPRALFSLARAAQSAGDTNSLALFMEFVGRFRTHERAPFAQWCIADHFYAMEDYYNAEKHYLIVAGNREVAELACQARMMAGRAAIRRASYGPAIDYFNAVYTNRSCSDELRVEAAMAAGDAEEASNRSRNFEEALGWFTLVTTSYPTNSQVPRAWCRIGDCNFQLARYANASNAYQQVLTLTNAGVAAWAHAKLGLASVAEKQAASKTGHDREETLTLAIKHCLDVLQGNDERPGEKPEPIQVWNAGLMAGRIAETLKQWQQAINIYSNLQELLPSQRGAAETRIANVQRQRDRVEKD